MVVTPSGIVIEVKPVQPENARIPMEVTLEGIVTEVKPLGHRTNFSPVFVKSNPFSDL